MEKLTLTSTIKLVADRTIGIVTTLADVYKPILRNAEGEKRAYSLKNELIRGFENIQRRMTCCK